ncbi:MAG: 5-formyltetrahydrofolate cyclo-ligase [Alphaproteobacteria bacterium]
MTLEDRKKAARAEAVERRAQAHATLAREKGAAFAGDALRRNFLAAVPVPDSVIVSGFWPVKDEIDDVPLLRHLQETGHACGLPVIVARGQPLRFRRWLPERPLVPGKWGIATPDESCELVRPALLLVPLLAFDREGNRLGYGAGFYDRTLAELRARTGTATVAVGVAYAAQEMPSAPIDETDERLDWIVTEREAIRIEARDAPARGRR